MATDHTVTLYRDDNRMGGRYGMHYYVERMNGVTVKIEQIDTRDRELARRHANAAASIYGARFVDMRPDASNYGWSSD